jgi:hypothetical protein
MMETGRGASMHVTPRNPSATSGPDRSASLVPGRTGSAAADGGITARAAMTAAADPIPGEALPLPAPGDRRAADRPPVPVPVCRPLGR